MNQAVPDLHLMNGITVPGQVVRGFLWGGVESGLVWLKSLPALIQSICRKHTITGLHLSPELRMNLVLFGESATHGPVAIKLSQPHPEVVNEITCLRVMSRTGAYPRLTAADEAAGWSLQERIVPGEMLQTLAQSEAISDAEATRITAKLMQETVRPVPDDMMHTFPDLQRWLKSLWEYGESGDDSLPAEQVELALRQARYLIDHPGDRMLLHGDFHHGNILQSDAGWTVIDPKGIVADRAFEIGPFFYNPIGVDKRENLTKLFDSRLEIFSQELEIDRVHLWRCALVACVLSDCWSLENKVHAHFHFDTVTAALMQLPERFA